MSGPIVRKYGFPNFEKIFGERELQHGVDEAEVVESGSPPEAAEQAPVASKAAAPKPKPKATKPKTKGKK